MAVYLKREAKLFALFTIPNLLMSHFGYAAIAAAAYLFKLAIAATLAAYTAFLCATLLGGLVTYLTLRALMGVFEYFRMLNQKLRQLFFGLQLGLSPMVGAFILNFALGFTLPLMPMLAVGGVSMIAGLTVLYVLMNCCQEDKPKLTSQDQKWFNRIKAAYPQGNVQYSRRGEHLDDEPFRYSYRA